MIVVTGATGKLGRHVVEGLLKKVPPSEIVAAVRNLGKASDLAKSGVQLREADYSKPNTLQAALTGAKKVLLISSSEVGKRAQQHKAVIEAAKAAGVCSIVYTSMLRADTSKLALAIEHVATERLIRESAIPYTFLRNGWYLENHTENLASALQHGVIIGAAGDGRFASATRIDYAAAAVTVLTQSVHANKIYELAGDIPFTLTELASEVSKQAGKPVVYQNLSAGDLKAAYSGFGIPEELAEILVDSDLGASKGELDSNSSDLRDLIGRSTTSLAAAVAHALRS